MKKTILIIILLGNSFILYCQDQLIFNDSSIIDCNILSIENNLIRYENNATLFTEIVLADTLKGYKFKNKMYVNSSERSDRLPETLIDQNTSNIYYRLSFFIPGLSIESRISKSLSVNAEVGTGYAQGRNNTDNYTELYIFYNRPEDSYHPFHLKPKADYTKLYPFIKLEIRQYYNLLRRQKKNRSIKNNSANYFSFYSLNYLDDLFFIGPTWGFQRNSKRFYFNMNLGGGIYYWKGGSEFQPLIDFKLGLILNR
ncbi:MAG TPA: hypothetical protein PK904_14555 [Bacteroidales bacterium]|nr:hypothetical protein [Bacteroidales bacterium]